MHFRSRRSITSGSMYWSRVPTQKSDRGIVKPLKPIEEYLSFPSSESSSVFGSEASYTMDAFNSSERQKGKKPMNEGFTNE